MGNKPGGKNSRKRSKNQTNSTTTENVEKKEKQTEEISQVTETQKENKQQEIIEETVKIETKEEKIEPETEKITEKITEENKTEEEIEITQEPEKEQIVECDMDIEEEYIIEDEGENFDEENYEFEEENTVEDNFGFSKIEKKQVDFESMDLQQLIEKQKIVLIELSSTLNIPVSICGLLLRSYQWKNEKLLIDFFDNPKKVYKEAGVDLDNISEKVVTGKKGEEVECPVCMDDVDGKDLMALESCKHFFCKNCWRNYLQVAIDDGPSCLQVSCLYKTCKFVVNEKIINETVDEKRKEKYTNYLSKSFIDDNPRIKWCPAPNCENVVFLHNLNQKSVKCKFGHNFCFSCSEENHQPCDCKQVKEWRRKCSDDSETTNFILSNTKECPKCDRNIEKNGGCNHMVCSQCKHEFCWICLDKWSIHGTEYYNCNRYKETEDKTKDNVSQARQLLEKYMHYFTRYQTHEQSQKFEGKLRDIAQEKMQQESLKHNKGWLDVDYIINGVEQLIECRAALKWTYVYAYYLPSGPQKELFEYLQQELEHNTENLSELLESTNFEKERIISMTKVAQSRLQHLIKGVDDGLQK